MESIFLDETLQVFHLNPGETAALYREIFVDGCYAAATKALRSGDTVLDVGANIGLSALYFHHHCPDLRMLCLEPQPRLRRAACQSREVRRCCVGTRGRRVGRCR